MLVLNAKVRIVEFAGIGVRPTACIKLFRADAVLSEASRPFGSLADAESHDKASDQDKDWPAILD